MVVLNVHNTGHGRSYHRRQRPHTILYAITAHPCASGAAPDKVYKALLVKGFIYISYVEVVANLNSLYKLSETDAVLHTPTGYSRVEVGSEHPINDSKQSLLPMGLCVPPCDACLEYIDLEMEKTTPDLMQSTNTLVSGLQFGDNKFMNV
jgi:hypothetical protein